MNSEEDTTMTNNDEEPITPNNGHLNDDSVGITPSPGNLSTSHVTQDTPNQASNNAPDSTKSIETSDSRKAGTPPAAVDTSVKTPSESKDHDVPMYEYGSGKPLAQTPTANTPVPPPPVLPQPHHSQLRPLNSQQHPFKSRPLDFPHESPPKKKRRKNAGVQSLPFLRNFSNISKILLEQENRAYNRKYNQHAGETKVVSSKQKAPQEVNVQVWQPAEVINFFRGVYLHGWGEWRRVCRMIQTRNNQQAKTHAQKLEKRFPELRTFFSVEKVKKMHERYGKVCRYEDGTESVTQPQETNARQKNNNGVAKSLTKRKEKITAPDENAIMAASVMKSLRQSGSRPSPPRRIVGKSLSQNVPKVTFCLGKYAIDTDASLSTKRTADSANPPAAPFTSSINIFIPGSRVYARWLDKEDPDSYGTWYPGYLTASKSDPGGENGSSDIPRLLYHITFDDGVEVLTQKAQDIMMHDHYRTWIKKLEEYYALPVTRNMVSKRLMKGSRVYAKFIDETDPEIHGKWIAGTVVNSKVSNSISQLRYTYHVLFVNGDQDEELKDAYVLEEELYLRLWEEKKADQRKKRPHTSSGLDFLCGALNMSSPIKSEPLDQSSQTSSASCPNGPRAMDSVDPTSSIESEDACPPIESNQSYGDIRPKVVRANTDAAFTCAPKSENDLHCHEVLDSRTPSPSEDSHVSYIRSPPHHYGCYFVTKTKNITTFAPTQNVQGSHTGSATTTIQKEQEAANSAALGFSALVAVPAVVPSTATTMNNKGNHSPASNVSLPKADAMPSNTALGNPSSTNLSLASTVSLPIASAPIAGSSDVASTMEEVDPKGIPSSAPNDSLAKANVDIVDSSAVPSSTPVVGPEGNTADVNDASSTTTAVNPQVATSSSTENASPPNASPATVICNSTKTKEKSSTESMPDSKITVTEGKSLTENTSASKLSELDDK